MKCIIYNQSVRILSRAIHSLARIGDEMIVEPFSHGLKLSTVDKSESAYAQFWFPMPFFYLYRYEDDERPEDIRLKISFKAFLTVFKTCHSLDKLVSSCTLQIHKDVPALIIKMQFNAGYSKTHRLHISDCVPVNVAIPSTGRNEIILPPKTLSTALRNFHSHQADITLAVNSRKTIINNYDDKTLDSSGQNIRSQLSLDPAEFSLYKIELETAINVTVREVKAMLAFAEHVQGTLKILFDEPLRPLLFNIIESGLYEANYMLATDASEAMQTFATASSTSSSVPSRSKGVRRVLSSEEDTDHASGQSEAKRVCTNNNDGNENVSVNGSSDRNSHVRDQNMSAEHNRQTSGDSSLKNKPSLFCDRNNTDRLSENVGNPNHVNRSDNVTRASSNVSRESTNRSESSKGKSIDYDQDFEEQLGRRSKGEQTSSERNKSTVYEGNREIDIEQKMKFIGEEMDQEFNPDPENNVHNSKTKEQIDRSNHTADSSKTSNSFKENRKQASSHESSRNRTNRISGHTEIDERRKGFVDVNEIVDLMRDDNAIDTFSDANLNEFPAVHSEEINGAMSQDMTTLNCYTPLNAEKMKIVFQNCLDGDKIGLEGVSGDGGRLLGKVLVYNSDEES